MKKSELVNIEFDIKKLDLNENYVNVFGIDVKLKDGKLIGKCDIEIKKSLLDAGKCDK